MIEQLDTIVQDAKIREERRKELTHIVVERVLQYRRKDKDVESIDVSINFACLEFGIDMPTKKIHNYTQLAHYIIESVGELANLPSDFFPDPSEIYDW